MTILITGATGFIGSHVARHLLQANQSVRLLVRDIEKAKAVFSRIDFPFNAQRCELVLGDITDAESIHAAMRNVQAVIHAAAATPIAAPSAQVLEKINVIGTKNILDAALAVNVSRFIYVSSATAVFNTNASLIDLAKPLTMPSMPYGRSKAKAENLVRDSQQQGGPISIIYPSGVIGPQDPGFSDAFKALYHRFNNGFRVFDEGGIQQVDVRDVAALISSIIVNGESTQALARHLIVGHYLSWIEQADLIDRVSGYSLHRLPMAGWKMRLLGRLFDLVRLIKKVDSPVSAEMMRYATQWPEMENSPALADHGIELHSPEKTMSDSLAALLAAGHLNKDQVPALA
jgi:dihydroflavonol-4-reductase